MISRIFQSARDIYSAGGATMRNVWMGDSDDGIHLFYGEVIENDSPMMGRDSERYERDGKPWDPFEPLGDGIILRKTLILDDVSTDEVDLTFVAREREGHNATLRITVNGNETLRPPSPIATPSARQYWKMAPAGGWNWSRWYYVTIPAEHLQPGDNVIEISTVEGAEGWEIMLGNYSAYHRGARPGETPAHAGAKSTDAGHTWHIDNMGTEADVVGEYVIRFDMRRYRPAGLIVSQVLDATAQDEAPVKQPLIVHSAAVAVEAELPYGTGLIVNLRWGDSPSYDPANWTSWEPVILAGGPVPAKGRYLQWSAELYTDDPTVTPMLTAVVIETDHQQPDPMPNLQVLEFDNAEILRSSFEFTSELYNHPKLRQLRQTCDLDKVIAGAQDDWEIIQRLMRWAYLMPLPNCVICPWDVLHWIEVNRDDDGEIIVNQYDRRRRDKMCLYSNVLLTEFLIACGIPARHVNINSEGVSGHEVCEAWSNTHRKWIHLDATRDFYWQDKTTAEPLSMLEIRNELVRHLDKPETWEDPHRLRLADKTLEDMRIEVHETGEWPPMEDNSAHLYQTTAHFRIVPRNDYYAQPYPLPISQGADVWGWDGYLNWADDMVPPMKHFSHHTNRPGDFYWTNNQTRMTLLSTELDALTVHLEHDMPNFARFEASIDGADWHPVATGFTLSLQAGTTELAVRAVNTLDLAGPVSRALIEFTH